MYGRGEKLRKPKHQIKRNTFISEEDKEKIRDRIFRVIRKMFQTEKEKEERERD